MTAAAPAVPAATTDRSRSWIPWAVLIGGIVVLQVLFRAADSFPAPLDTFFSDPLDRAGTWLRENRRSHWLFVGFFTPITNVVRGGIDGLNAFLQWLPWYVVIGLAALVPLRVKQSRQALVIAGVLLYAGLFGLWEPTMETLALMGTAVLLAVILGVPLGILNALKPRVEQLTRPLLDAMQTIPAFVYFLPLIGFFGIGDVNAAVATVIYALPPVVRLTTLGIRQVPEQTVEASKLFGATRRQTLLKVQVPIAIPTILTGLSQTIMMALGIVVLATLIGAGGLGSEVLESLNQRRPGRGIAAGLAIVAVAMVLDRVWRSIVTQDRTRRMSKKTVRTILAALAVGLVAGVAAGWSKFPAPWDWTAFDFLDRAVVWARDSLVWFTRPLNEVLVGWIYVPVKNFLTFDLAWPILAFVTGWVGWKVKGWKLALFGAVSVSLIGAIGLWELSIDTLVQVMAAVIISVLVAVPLGIWAGRRPKVEAVMGPILDALQTVPSLVYIIPVVAILGSSGVLPGLIASVLYAIVPGIRITALGIRSVPKESIEASETFGATPRQTMWGVRVPLAASTIMAAVNQVIMMVLAMVIISGFVGGG
ncbi:MAG: ABC transporter permease subunit, partial [Acidimicrobiia bacterium]|nr:ABC transporter permease subunit [Acidimicrobiia bacterium]